MGVVFDETEAAIVGIPHVVVIASEGAENSLWIGWEILSSFATARCLIICWVSGEDPRRWITPLPRLAYRFFPGPSAFLIDARKFVSTEPILRIAFPDSKVGIQAAIHICLRMLIAALVFDISRRVFQIIGYPAEPIWAVILAALTSAWTAVVSFPRLGVMAYRIQRSKLPSTQLIYEGQTGSRIVLLTALLTAFVIVVAAAGLHIAPTREHIGTMGAIVLFMYTMSTRLYLKLIGYPLARMNARAVNEGAYHTAQRLDAARKT
jgi:hypothetical protein